MLVLALCLVSISEHTRWLAGVAAACEDGVPSEAWPLGQAMFIICQTQRRLPLPLPACFAPDACLEVMTTV